MEIRCGQCGMAGDGSNEFCPQCGSRLRQAAAIPSAGRGRIPSRRRWLTYAGAVAVLAAGLLTYFGDAFRTFHPIVAAQPEISGAAPMAGRVNSTLVKARLVGSMFIISLNDVRSHRIVRFFDPEGKQTIPVLAYIAPSGRLVTSMSLSESCHSTDFYLEGENIHCAQCPSYWNASSMEAYACCQKYYPEPIPSTVLGDDVRIETASVRNWKARS